MAGGRHLTVTELNNRYGAIEINAHTRVLPGDAVYLVPVKPTAPGVAYKHPRGVVIWARKDAACVELEDGTRVTTAGANVRWNPPEPPAAPKLRTLPKRKHVPIDPEHGEETTIFGFLNDGSDVA